MIELGSWFKTGIWSKGNGWLYKSEWARGTERSRLMSLLCNRVDVVVSGACLSVLMNSAGTGRPVGWRSCELCECYPRLRYTEKIIVSVEVEVHLMCYLSLTLAFKLIKKIYFFFPFFYSSCVLWRMKSFAMRWQSRAWGSFERHFIYVCLCTDTEQAQIMDRFLLSSNQTTYD